MFYTYFIPYFIIELSLRQERTHKRHSTYHKKKHTIIFIIPRRNTQNPTLHKKNTIEYHKNTINRQEEYKVLFIISHHSQSKISSQPIISEPRCRAIQFHFNVLYLFYYWFIPNSSLTQERTQKRHCTYHKKNTQYISMGAAAPPYRIPVARFARWARPRHTRESHN